MSTDTPDWPSTGTERETVGIRGSESGVAVVDPIERRREFLWTVPESVRPASVATDRVEAPVGAAASLDVEQLGFGRPTMVYVREPDWTMVDHVEEGETATYDGEFVVQTAGPIKIYLRVSGAVSVETDDETRFAFGEDAEVLLGARSLHSRPAAEIRTTPDPESVMAALSTAGNALQTTTPERSWPNLRGHPPAIRLGDSLSIPDGVTAPVPEIRVVVPADLRYVYPAAPLCYYLGARMVPGSEPRIETDEGLGYPLAADPGDLREFERRVARILQGTLLLECLCRDEGMTQLPLHERQALADELPVALDRFYHRSPERRVELAISVPFERIEEYVPQWKVTTHVPPAAKHAPLVPHLLDDLALITTRTGESGSDGNLDAERRAQMAEIETFLRDAGRAGVDGDVLHRSPQDVESAAGDLGEYTSIRTPETPDALEDVWVGDTTPLGASHATKTAYENRLDREPSEPPIDVALVCNDPEMADELDAADVYGAQENLPFEVAVYKDLSTAALRTRLELQSTDFFHYIGHADEDGLRCTDGRLDLATLDGTATDAFLLNACDSYRQGLALIEAGATGGVVTRQQVADAAAARVGETVVHLLNGGYPLRAAMAVCEDVHLVSDHYLIVGDGGVTVAQSSIAELHRVERIDEDLFRYQDHAHPSTPGLGGVARSHLDHPELDYWLIGNSSPTVEVERERLERNFRRSHTPVLVDGELHWSSTISLETVCTDE